MPNSRNLSQQSDEIAAYLGNNPNDRGKGRGPGHDVSKEPRVPKGHHGGGQWTKAGSGPPIESSASAHGSTVTIIHADGSVEIRKGGSAAWRNNNPGNIGAGDWANRHGAIGSDGTWAIFPDEATGEAALEAELNGPDYRSLTVDGAVAKRTPAKDKRNNTPQAQKNVRDFSGLPGDVVIQNLNPAEKQRLYGAIRRNEGWLPGSATPIGRE